MIAVGRDAGGTVLAAPMRIIRENLHDLAALFVWFPSGTFARRVYRPRSRPGECAAAIVRPPSVPVGSAFSFGLKLPGVFATDLGLSFVFVLLLVRIGLLPLQSRAV